MKRKAFVFLSVIIIAAMLLFYGVKSDAKVNLNSNNQVTMVSLLTPPQQKVLTRSADIDQLQTLLNGIRRKYQLRLHNPKNWVILIKTDDETILVCEGYMILHGDYYTISSQDEMKVIDFYNSLDLTQKTYKQ
jgi:hypothetical protein